MKARRRPVTDELSTDEGLAVLVNDQVLVLSPVAGTLLGLLDEASWTSVEDLVGPLLSTYGEPEGDPLAAVRDAVAALSDNGLVEVVDEQASRQQVDKT